MKTAKIILRQIVALLLGAFGLGFVMTNPVRAQDAVSIAVGNTYAFTVPAVVSRYYITTDSLDKNQKQVVMQNYRFIIIAERGDYYIIQFPKWTGADSISRNLNERLVEAKPPEVTSTRPNASSRTAGRDTARSTIRSTNLQQSVSSRLFFAVQKKDLEKIVYRIYPRWRRPEVAAGTVIIPVKMRFNQFDFSRDFALGFTLGPRWRISEHREHYLHLLGAFNVNIITVDSASTEGRIKKSTDKGALGLGLGLVFDFNGPQAGIFTGFDWLGRRDKSNWVYQGHPWLSVGMGFTIFSRNNSSPATQSSTNSLDSGKKP